MSSHVIETDIDVYSAFAVTYYVWRCRMTLWGCFTGICIISMILSMFMYCTVC